MKIANYSGKLTGELMHEIIAANVHRLSAVLVFRVPAAGLQLLIKDRKLIVYSKADPKIVRWDCS